MDGKDDNLSNIIKHRRTGRPTKMTSDVVRKLEHAFAVGASDVEACYYADISRDTLYRWIKENPHFSDKVERLRQMPILKAREELIRGLDGNPDLALKFLERKLKDEFGVRQEIKQEFRGSLNLTALFEAASHIQDERKSIQ